MAATFFTYANATAMNADHSKANGSYAQLVSDMAAGSNVTYIYSTSSSLWSALTVSPFCTSGPYLFGLLSSGATPTFVSSVLAAGEVHLIEHGFCLADGSRDEEPIISALSAALAALGGGKIIFDRPP